jgi:Sensors of blue-light using FAD
MSTLSSLLYISLAPSSADEEAVSRIVASAHRRNKALGVSGALLKYAGYYLQVLEGDHKTVHALYERIRHDTRHFDARIVAFDAAAQRLFDGWGMHHVPEPKAHDRAVSDFLRSLWRGRGSAHANTARSLLQRLISASSPSAAPAHH